jgi:anthranilate synthase component 1
MQAVLSREVSFKGNFNPFTLYRALRLINPSPYMFYMNFGDLNLIGSSPEILVQNFQDKVTIRPIAGTRKRGIDESEDLQNKIDLIGDDKEKAEHMMLVDLARNDVSKVSNPSTVSVDEMMIVEKYSHVMHMTSNVIGQIKDSATPIDCLKAALPAGTLSGAPKIRAMEILSELENRARGIYGGCVGYIGYNKSLDTAIIIRTALHKKDEVKVGVGAGIVFDSEPQNEWNETVAKLNVFLEALKYE